MKIEPRTCSQSDVYRVLGRTRAEALIAAGWLKPRVERLPKEQGRGFKIFAIEDVRRCEDRILQGEFPESK